MTQEELERLLSQVGRPRHFTDSLSERELEAFSLFTIGFWPHQICEEMAIRPRELKKLKAAMRKKLGLKSEIELLKLIAAHFDGPGSLNLPTSGCIPGLGGSEDRQKIIACPNRNFA